ncbi:CLUMA_CG016010, isoform A [Clunio marinus]|uniref:CLUMA_CG016010, isoform A n=1 Tax=Clunio marinus TaxID=568069 RepID=A0A1J1IRI8_9DIPT|nr:CLUMA_CG016010, isoform A [Clunio marinus]
MSSSCFSDNSKSFNGQMMIDSHSIERFVIENPLLFRICCCCLVRRRKRVDTAKQNGISNHVNGHTLNSSSLNIDNIELAKESPIITSSENAKQNGNELTIQPLTTTISLVESDDTRSEQDVVKTQPKSRISEDIDNKEMVENYVEEQTRRISGNKSNSHILENFMEEQIRKTNSHILSDNDNNQNSFNSTPMHLSKEPTSSEIAHVRNEIAQIQSVIENVRMEMVQIQKQQAFTTSPKHQTSRPKSVTSSKTFDNDDVDLPPPRPKTSMDFVTIEEVERNSNPKISSRPTTPKSILKPESPFHRVVTPKPDDVLDDIQTLDSPYDSTTAARLEDVMMSHGLDEIDESANQECFEPLTDSQATTSKDNEAEDDNETIDVENIEYQQAFSPQPPEEITITIQRSPSRVKRQAPLKRNHKVTPVKNPMPNINQPSQVPLMLRHNSNKVANSHLFPPSLRRFERPKDAIQTCLSQLDSSSWENVMDGLVIFVRLIRHHPEYVDTQIHLLTIALAKHVKNLRSQVSRAACSAASEFFITNAKALDADAEELASALLNRTADTNKFLRADALKALESMCDALHPSKVVLILTFRGATHQNAAVRCTTAKLLCQLVFRVGCDKVFNLHKDIRDRLILTGANLLMEGSLETRNYTKELFKQLSIHSHYQKLLLDVIPPNIYRNIEKSLKSIR